MKRMFISRLLIVVLLSSITGSVVGVSRSSESVSIPESKVISTATLDDDFADNSVIITLTNKASLAMKEYSTSDFSAIHCKTVTNLSTASQKIAKAKLAVRGEATVQNRSEGIDLSLASKAMDIETYHQVLCLELEEKGKENVLEAIKILQERDDVLCAEPNYYMTLCTTTPNDPYYVDQYARSVIHLPTA